VKRVFETDRTMDAPQTMSASPSKRPSLWDALLPTVALVVMLSTSVYLFSDDSSYGANQIALLLCAFIAVMVGMKNGIPWAEIEPAIYQGIGLAMSAILILLAVGALIGTWILSGTVPTIIYYGLELMNPSWFYVSACIVCALVSLSIGSSWTVAGTIGVGMIGVAAGLGLSIEITAGAIISGAYFGDKLSPLSDTTNLAPAVVGTDLFAHIQHLLWTTVPSILLSLMAFAYLGLSRETATDNEQTQEILALINNTYQVSVWLLLPLLMVLLLAWKKVAALPSILIGALLGGVFAVNFQPEVVYAFASDDSVAPAMALLKGVWVAMFDGYQSNTGNEVIDSLLSRGGMSSMLNTVWLIISAMTFGAAMEKAGLLARLIEGVLSRVHSTAGLVTSTVLTCIGCNIITADQYISIILPGRMYKLEYARRKLAPVNLSRTLEDSATVTSALIPWNTCGAFMAGTLGVATLAYAPYCFFNLICPVVAIGYAMFNVKILLLDKHDNSVEPVLNPLEQRGV